MVPDTGAAVAAGKMLEDLPRLWEKADLGERRRVVMNMLDAVYVDTVEEIPQVCPSMGPRPFGHGNLTYRPVTGAGVPPSMGPRPFGHGNLAATSTSKPPPSLQWGHGLSAMETKRRWGDMKYIRYASMGPRPFGHGNAEVLIQAGLAP